MPSPRQQLKGRRGWNSDHFAQLHHGYDFFGDAWGRTTGSYGNNDAAEIREDMAACWHRHGVTILAEFRADKVANCGQFPWGWWRFQSPVPRDESQPEWYQLWKLNLIDESEAREAAQFEIARDRLAGWHGRKAFRRSKGFWCFVSFEPRDETICEVSQLVRMKILTDREKQFLDGDEKAIRESVNSLRHLTAEECLLLGIEPHETAACTSLAETL